MQSTSSARNIEMATRPNGPFTPGSKSRVPEARASQPTTTALDHVDPQQAGDLRRKVDKRLDQSDRDAFIVRPLDPAYLLEFPTVFTPARDLPTWAS
jgi:hypothetical protein